MPENFADRLLAACKAKNTVACLGLDVVYERLPAAIREDRNFNDPANTEVAVDALLTFAQAAIKAVEPYVAAVKINSAFFERYYSDGLQAYRSLTQEVQSQKLLCIGDVKRADIGDSGRAYAEAQLGEPNFENLDEGAAPDAVTVNPYMGLDGILPFLEIARSQGRGVFVLVRTSNETARDFQDFKDGASKPLYQHIAERCAGWAEMPGQIGKSGYSCLGAVVGGTYPDDTKKLRSILGKSLFLVPGYGAQGATAADCARAFNADGRGAIVTASRSVLYAYENPDYVAKYADNWERCIAQAARDMRDELNRALGKA